ncbi:Sugar phosphate isomerase/epimerase [Paenibacillus sp. yr247]|uniref:sugar phosphate isomerase/epimerase family protein n=1 Tax=Paenibacillus sp. yr247 TaxID=1761880 RepID=UPI00088233E6|nr:sugar phosphate isomerase/epimerase family protein [Paenibacillus sp. yr247]SDP17722.1 Sugar phosphate isomerase/epimerase [Paenibacillus sp. yr247]
MVTITCFADEVSADLTEQLDVMASEGLRHIELRNVWGKNVLELTDEDKSRVKAILDEKGFRISSIGSPLGKYSITEPFEPQVEAMRTAVAAAQYFDAKYIRVFSYFIPAGEHEQHRDEVLLRMRALTRLAEEGNVVLIIENESGVYGDLPERCLEILQACDSAHAKLAFDPGNFVNNGVKPVSEAYPLVSEYTDYVHVKDATREPSMFVPAGAGDGEFSAFIAKLKQRGFTGFLSVEPHLHKYLPEATNPERVVAAVRALKKLLADADIQWQ